jgi:protein-S-isoprenylcysteine O-methyltransferase Ste14
MASTYSRRPFNQKKRLLAMQVGAVLASALLLLSRPGWNEAAAVHEFIEVLGFALVIFCVLGRLWSILYVGGKKNAELIMIGPYSMTRNPLYFFSTMGAVGIGLMFGSLIAAVLLGYLTFQILVVTARKEADYLSSKFGSTYATYAHQTPMFWPNPLQYNDLPEINFSPVALKRTFVDGLYFLAIFPAIEFVEYLRSMGFIPALIALY